MMDDFINALELFNEKAEKLSKLTFTKIMLTQPTGFRLNVEKTEDGSLKAQTLLKGPCGESVDALLLTLRFFMLSNESSSFARLGDFYEKAGIERSLKDEFCKVRAELNEFLDTKGNIHIKFNSEDLTHRLILNTMINGGGVHANDAAAVARYRKWINFPMFAQLIANEFNHVLATFVGFVGSAWEINKRVLAQLKKGSI